MIKKERVNLTNIYLTPLAAILVLSAIFISRADAVASVIGLFLILFTIFFNNFTVYLIKKRTALQKSIQGIGVLRMAVNYLANILIVYFFAIYWTPIWIMLFLNVLGAAVYGTFKETFSASIVAAATLIVIFAYRHLLTNAILWGHVLNYALFIIAVSLFINLVIKNCNDTKPS